MKKLFYSVAAICVLAVAYSCDEAPENPGDFSLPSMLEVSPAVVSHTDGTTYELKVALEKDTTYVYTYIVNEPVLDENDETTYIEVEKKVTSKITARYIEMDTVWLPAKADTFSIQLKSNARWKAPVPSAGGKTQWYFNYNILNGGTTTSGGGDGHLDFRTLRNRNKKRPVPAEQYIVTSDSTIMYKLVFRQAGERD